MIVVKSFQDECLKFIVWMCCSFFFMISIALKLVSKTLGVKEYVGTLGWKWWKGSKGLFGLAFVQILLKLNMLENFVGTWETLNT